MLLVTLLLVVVTATGSAANTLVAGNVTTVVGSEAVLRCSFLGNTSSSSTDLQIMKKGNEELSPSRIEASETSAVLTITSAVLSDAGEFVCKRSQGNNTISISLFLFINELTVSVTPTNVSVPLGSDVELYCMSSGDISWFKNGQPLPASQGTSILRLTQVNFFDMATYVCVGRQGTQEKSATSILRINEYRAPFVIGNPNIFNAIDSADTLVVKCDVMGNPSPRFVWQRMNKDIQIFTATPRNYSGVYTATNGSLLLQFARVEDSGVYICYGIDPVLGVNASSPFSITIHKEPQSIWTTWYFLLIYSVIALGIALVFTLLCYFCSGNRDICFKKRTKLLHIDKQLVQNNEQVAWLDSMRAPNLAYEMNFGSKQASPIGAVGDAELGQFNDQARNKMRASTPLAESTPADRQVGGSVSKKAVVRETAASAEEEVVEKKEKNKFKLKKSNNKKKAVIKEKQPEFELLY